MRFGMCQGRGRDRLAVSQRGWRCHVAAGAAHPPDLLSNQHQFHRSASWFRVADRPELRTRDPGHVGRRAHLEGFEGADLMRGIPWPVAVLLIAACAGSPVAGTPSPGSLAASTTVGSHGSLFFVSDSVGWEVTEPPDALRTVILRTEDGGAHWRIWGIAPEAGAPPRFTTTGSGPALQKPLPPNSHCP